MGQVNAAHYFTATALPGNVSLPLTFYWQATGQAPVTHVSNASASDVVSYTWNTTGTQTITVTVSNAGGSVSDTHGIDVSLYQVYLPLVIR
jgi:PKD repeat protein